MTVLNLLQQLAPLPEPIVEFGSRRYHPRRPTVSQALQQPVLGCDLLPGPGVDRLADLHAIDMPDRSVATVLLMDTIEHVARPHQALKEVARIIRPGGLLVMTSHFYFPIHGYPDDYWRFTASGFLELLRPFAGATVYAVGPEAVPHTVVGVAQQGPLDTTYCRVAAATLAWVHRGSTTWKERSLLALPPAWVGWAYRLLQRIGR